MIRAPIADRLFHKLLLKVPTELLTRIDKYATDNGIKTRTQAILQLLSNGC